VTLLDGWGPVGARAVDQRWPPANFVDAYGMRPQPSRRGDTCASNNALGNRDRATRFERRVYGLARCACADWTVNLSPHAEPPDPSVSIERATVS
jgi:hypothetical protein